MIERRSIISAVFAALAVAGIVRADVARASRPDPGCPSSPASSSQIDPVPAKGPDLFAYWATDIDLSLPGTACVPRAEADAGPTGQAQHLHLLVEGQSSLDLFLYALMGLGLCRSAPWVKKFSFDLIPDWYHSSGPFQIGHSLAVGPDLCFAPVYCFVQPDCRAQDCPPQYYRGTIVSLWRKSQFTPTILASRGPPSLTY